MKSAFQRVRRLLRRAYHRASASRDKGLEYEADFWKRFLGSGGLEWRDEYARRLDPATPLAPYYRQFIDDLPRDQITILDVGAGPLTLLGKTHPHKTIAIVATDVLAPEYDRLLDQFGITPPVRTVAVDAERLAERFPPAHFDLAIAQNCVDHMSRPLVAIEQMLAVVRPGCWVILDHWENEAENEDYVGLHQWNFTIEDGRAIIAGRRERIDLTAQLATRATVHCRREDRWIRIHLQRHAP